METKSILDQIMNNNQAEEAARLDAAQIINNLFNQLNARERDVLIRRFGLDGQDRQTLEEIGKIHNLTRERIRQIETLSISRLRQRQNLENYLNGFKKVINHLLEGHGGLMEKQYLFKNLLNLSLGANKKDPDQSRHQRHFDFLISKLLPDEFEEIKESPLFEESFKLKYKPLDHLEALTLELVERIRQAKKLFMTADLINLAKELDAYKIHQSEFSQTGNLDISGIFSDDSLPEQADLINQNKAVYSVLEAAKKIQRNKFGYWGLDEWREIKPKTINDKIYLVLKNSGKPMHFAEIALRINQVSFDHKIANPATVHNELILDDKYILVGRGLYSLKEWGCQKGTVADVIEKILTQAGRALSRQEIIDKVLEQRLVKKATINLALMNREKFETGADGKYCLKN